MAVLQTTFPLVNLSIVRGPDNFRTFGKIGVDKKHFIDSAAPRYELPISSLRGALHGLEFFR